VEPLVQFHERHRRAKAERWIVASGCGSPEQAARIARQSVANKMHRVLDDLLLLRRSSGKVLRCAGMEGAEHLDRAIASGKGVILLTGHFSANRICEHHMTAIGYPMLSVHNQKPRNDPGGRLGVSLLQTRIIELQCSANPDVVYVQDPECSLKILQRLRSGGLVNIQFDGVARTKVVQRSFLGISWRFPAGMLEIVRIANCAVVPMLCLGGSAGFVIRFSPPLQVTTAATRDEFVDANVPLFMSVLEQQVREHPEEWRLWTLV
jgi:lauroyl/myristoyl acyltransferase